jgi:hypothetical protein
MMAILIERGYLEGPTLDDKMTHSLFHFWETSHGQLRDYRFVWQILWSTYDVSATLGHPKSGGVDADVCYQIRIVVGLPRKR